MHVLKSLLNKHPCLCDPSNCTGDHLQLPPTVVSEEAARKGLGNTLFERLQVRRQALYPQGRAG